MKNRFYSATCWLAVALCSAPAMAQKKAPKSAPVDRKVLAQHRTTIQNSTKGLTKESVEECQAQLDAADKAYRAWLTEKQISASDKQVEQVSRLVDKRQEEIDKKRGTPPKRPEFKPFVGVWRARGGSCEVKIDEFGRGLVFVDVFKEEGFKGSAPLTKSIVVDTEERSFTLPNGSSFLEESHFTLADDDQTMTLNVTIRTTPPTATQQKTVRKSFQLIREAK